MTLRILGDILYLIWTYYLFLLNYLLIIIAGTFESRKEGRSKEEKGVMTGEKWIGRSEESMKKVLSHRKKYMTWHFLGTK